MPRRKNGNIIKSLSLAPAVIERLEEEAWKRKMTQSDLVSHALATLFKMEEAMSVEPVEPVVVTEPDSIEDILVDVTYGK
jgi:hypothetical protein